MAAIHDIDERFAARWLPVHAVLAVGGDITVEMLVAFCLSEVAPEAPVAFADERLEFPIDVEIKPRCCFAGANMG